LNEILISKSLNNENIVKFLGYSIDKDVFYLVNEFESGGNLASYLNQNNNLTIQQKYKILIDIVKGIKINLLIIIIIIKNKKNNKNLNNIKKYKKI
jgi:serine/threonine protein kinase